MKRDAWLLVICAAAIVAIAAVVWRAEREEAPVKDSAASMAEVAGDPTKESSDGARHSRALMYLLR